MITVEKAIKDNKTKNAVGAGSKKPMVKKILIGTLVIAGIYFGYKMIKGKNEKVQPINP